MMEIGPKNENVVVFFMLHGVFSQRHKASTKYLQYLWDDSGRFSLWKLNIECSSNFRTLLFVVAVKYDGI